MGNNENFFFIPIFTKDSNNATGTDGVYKVDIRNGAVYPCYNISTSGYITPFSLKNGTHFSKKNIIAPVKA